MAVLIDPEKEYSAEVLQDKVAQAMAMEAGLIFVGGSTMPHGRVQSAVSTLKSLTDIPVIIFPGSAEQVSTDADAMLFLNLVSGRNPDFLIGQQKMGARLLRGSTLPVIPTGYILLDGGKVSSTQLQSRTTPIAMDDLDEILDTALAAKLMGMTVIYMDAGSGAPNRIPSEVISMVKKEVGLPLIIGGGVRDVHARDEAWASGADVVVVGNALEEDPQALINTSNSQVA